ncbi:error-prone DNA polymerase [Dyella sp. OK004]|uniref:error-prone DNA polymerase n=1 Tax=Dyella sp. OK004 TaxID=1855292 RepID=UPI0008E7761B|nr:error-prone DNA polymerase [Dyella sp. OK004]SFS08567.1 error-prone DNA polymerase [Dyella sp. OK004]
MNAYAELHCLSNFSFQRGASSAMELFQRAKACGYSALAITDECSLAGIVRAYEASLETKLDLIVGAEFKLDDGLRFVLLCESREGYAALCGLITQGRRASAKGTYHLTRASLANGLPGTLALWLPDAEPDASDGHWLGERFAGRVWLAIELHRGPDDAARLRQLERLAADLGMPAVAAGDVHMHVRGRRALQDTLTAIRHGLTVAQAGVVLFKNGERHLRAREVLAEIYPVHLLEETARIAERCRFTMDQLHYRYPAELVPEGHSATSWLRQLTEEGIQRRWPDGISPENRETIEKELTLIGELEYEHYFLTVEDIVCFARRQNIFCQGRGSAANSVVCYALGVTSVSPDEATLLTERFMSASRKDHKYNRPEPPDIDIDFEHERREEVIQYIYRKYGRERTALAATVISYRGRSAARDVGKALGLSPDQVSALSSVFAWRNGGSLRHHLQEAGLDFDSPLLQRVLILAEELRGFPRHLSQHVGGFVISDAPLSQLVPVENAAMPDRTIIQWDKDDLDRMNLLKVDCLALGMLTCVRKCFDLMKQHENVSHTLASIPLNDNETYKMIQKADTIGVFQIESRAQMSMLPRLRPKNFYDLVIQVAIVRPGPIQGDMVHPYLRRRRKEEDVTYPSEALREVLERTLGVPLFQEQVMRIAMVAAGYTGQQADELRRAMAAWKRHGGMEKHRDRLFNGMKENNYSEAFAAQIFEQIKGFGSYGFPESHAAGFAKIAYASAWLKCRHPAAFACALLNSQPMGFYSASQIVQDAQRHHVQVLPVDVRHSDWDCTLERDVRDSTLAIRLGFRQVRGFNEQAAQRISQARERQAFLDIVDLCTRASLDRRHQDLLADTSALRGLAGHRHRAKWAVTGVEPQLPLFGRTSPDEQTIVLPPPSVAENLHADYARTGLSLGPHPVRLLRARLRADRYKDSRELSHQSHQTRVRTAGLVTQRQQPQTASGITFITLEDEHGNINVIVRRQLAERQRRPYLEARLMGVEGHWENVDGVSHLVAHRLLDMSDLLGQLDARSRDFH